MIKYLLAGRAVAETCVSSMQPNIWAINSLKDGLLPGVISPFNEGNTRRADSPS